MSESREKSASVIAETRDATYGNLASRPGFLIRRLHQIHVAIFLEECKEFNITPVQYSILTALRDGELDQTGLANRVGMDLATTTQVLKRLEERGWVRRTQNLADRRQRIVSLTDTGARALRDIDTHAQRAHERTVAQLGEADRERFTAYLIELVEANNHYSRAPIKLS